MYFDCDIEMTAFASIDRPESAIGERVDKSYF